MARRRARIARWLSVGAVLGSQLLGPAAVLSAQEPLSGAGAEYTQAQSLRGWSLPEFELSTTGTNSIEVNETMTLAVTVRNTSEVTASNLQVTVRRDDRLESLENMSLASYPYYGPAVYPRELDPGESIRLQLEVPTGFGSQSTLAIDEPGAYPVLLTLTGTVDGEPAALAETDFLLDVRPNSQQQQPQLTGREMTVILPLSAPVDIVPGETGVSELILRSENLAQEFADGRLATLLDLYLEHDRRDADGNRSGDLAQAACVAVDPDIVATADRMSRGYTVADSRPPAARTPQRLRDSWGSQRAAQRGEAGTGAQAAAQWLEKLAQAGCIMPLPFAGVDTATIAAADNPWLFFEAVDRGPQLLAQVLDRPIEPLLPMEYTTVDFLDSDFVVSPLVSDESSWPGRAAVYDARLARLLADPNSASAALRVALSTPVPPPAAATDDAPAEPAPVPHTVALMPPRVEPQLATRVFETAVQLRAAGVSGGSIPLESTTEQWNPPALNPARVQNIAQQARYADDLMYMMHNTPDVALSRYDFILPLRQAILRGEDITPTLAQLRSSVALIPPGNVYTRTSESSPMLIVAENGLPLPVNARLAFQGNATLNTPQQVHIPAAGSITVTMTAELYGDDDPTELQLWLATEDNRPISQPVTIAVQTRSLTLGPIVAAAGVIVVAGAGILQWRRRRSQESRQLL